MLSATQDAAVFFFDVVMNNKPINKNRIEIFADQHPILPGVIPSREQMLEFWAEYYQSSQQERNSFNKKNPVYKLAYEDYKNQLSTETSVVEQLSPQSNAAQIKIVSNFSLFKNKNKITWVKSNIQSYKDYLLDNACTDSIVSKIKTEEDNEKTKYKIKRD